LVQRQARQTAGELEERLTLGRLMLIFGHKKFLSHKKAQKAQKKKEAKSKTCQNHFVLYVPFCG
jgi:hypothetical protein